MGLQLQMSWQPILLSPKRKKCSPLGLENLGNSCYLNSVLQCLTYTPPLANFCLRKLHSSLCDSSEADRKKDCPFCILEKRIVRSLSLDLTLDAPRKINNCLRIFAQHFRCGRQEDAHEFLRYVIDACHNTCLRLKKLGRIGGTGNDKGSSSVVKEIFGGALQSQVKCLSCGNESNKVDEIMDISLDVFHSNSLKEALQRFFKPEILDGNNKYKCESCMKLVPARKQMSIVQAPNILVIQLKRFEGTIGSKIDKDVGFGEILLLSSFMCKESQDLQPEYKLFGTIVHSGFSPESGHYYAYIKDAMGRWYCCNDSFVSLSTLEEVLSEKVYILFFSRTNQKPEAANPYLSHTALNGVKSHDCNGHEASKYPNATLPQKGLHLHEESPKKDVPIIAKVNTAPSSPRMRFNINGNSGSKITPGVVNGKLIVGNGVVKTKRDVKDTIDMGKNEKEKSTLVWSNGNGLSKTEKVHRFGTRKSQDFVSTKENGNSLYSGANSVKSDNHEASSTKGRLTTEQEENISNGSTNIPSVIYEPKRKSKDYCILLANDAQSREKIEELKKFLEKDATSVLRSCDWSDKVSSFMSSRKRCIREAGISPSNSNEIRKLLIMDAKKTFTSQIPESLKADLIKHIRSFSEER